ncbi:hypothetical protein [Gracilimonas sediminicola]|uniref:Uncharacterized protein n=1 Tax=Gracilimonas sediminicola TaxID=2952158 RepID=A0A9X2RF24_9BACT|nr:hypothetical protein [Gracilimonas sediminicola]MCP9290548.1 hypothetical protein [Gracilimonas sediminicola]
MSDNGQSKQPTHNVFFIKDNKDGEQFWQKVGAAWEHKDEKGLTQKIEFFGFNVELVVREADEQSNKTSKSVKSQEMRP